MEIEQIEQRLGKKLFDHQLDCLVDGEQQVWREERVRQCYYYPTGKGKSITALATLAYLDKSEAVVITPPSAHGQWQAVGRQLGMSLTCMSHAKFRMKSTQMSRDVPVIADEFHLFGGHSGQGWKKLDGLARGLRAPLLLASATPNYNDADRVYCIQHILDPASVKGGFLQFLYENCVTQQNHFSMMPDVIGFRHHGSAEEYLAAMPKVFYLPDTVQYTIEDITIPEKLPAELTTFGYNRRRHRMIASQIEERHARINLSLIADDGLLHPELHSQLEELIFKQSGPTLVYANHSTVAESVAKTLMADVSLEVVTGKTSLKEKQELLDQFRSGVYSVLVGTATLATGTDGLDKVCDTLIILDDTDDDALRRQIVGRILPRGEDTDASMKKIYRWVLS